MRCNTKERFLDGPRQPEPSEEENQHNTDANVVPLRACLSQSLGGGERATLGGFVFLSLLLLLLFLRHLQQEGFYSARLQDHRLNGVAFDRSRLDQSYLSLLLLLLFFFYSVGQEKAGSISTRRPPW